MENKTNHFNQSLTRGLSILEFIADHDGKATLTIISRGLGLDKATTKRFLDTLTGLGYIRLSEQGKTFSITLKALRIGYSAVSNLGWRDIARFHIEQLFAELRETVSLCVLDDTEILYLLRLNRENFWVQDVGIGSRRPAYASSMGKMLLALEPPERAERILAAMHYRPMTPHTVTSPEELRVQMEEARRNGYAVSDQEISLLTRSVSAPIMNGDKAVAALAIALRVDDYTREDMIRLMAPKALACAAQIATALKQVEFRPDIGT